MPNHGATDTTGRPSVPEQAAAPPATRWSLARTFAALQYPNYRLWFAGQLVSLVGTWMQTTAQGFLVFQITHSPAYLGYVGFAAGLPSWLLMLYGGVLADRLPRRGLLVIAQTAMMILAFILAALAFLNLVQPWHIVALAFLLGVANAFDAPARQAFVLEMVDRKDLTNAIALNSTMFNLATAVGPAIAGVTYALVGPAWCFTLNGISFVAVIAALLLMKLRPVAARPRPASSVDELKEGLRYAISTPIIRTLIGMVAATSLFGLAFATLLPAWAVTILGGDAATNGLLQSARGVGALIAALMIASLGQFKFRGSLLTLGQLVFPILLVVFAFVRWLPLSLALLVGIGWGFMTMLNMANVLVQTYVPDKLRGRVMSIYALTLFGFMPVGALLAGAVAEGIGGPATVAIGALVTLGIGVLLWLRVPQLRALN